MLKNPLNRILTPFVLGVILEQKIRRWRSKNVWYGRVLETIQQRPITKTSTKPNQGTTSQPSPTKPPTRLGQLCARKVASTSVA
ncbi:unnamed protein product [Parascedosporium putredinis]|uniref:Uncharacterized protein n=1 Tax=Parascedosporium putredinis TaxID=1442378 RepID=A0A9P1GWJ8_9PEZI|nr:unnamed protein product [Parascedosporium putredinis]CAI7988858.1 unnamed protein product [Parascedosporium putredinis]